MASNSLAWLGIAGIGAALIAGSVFGFAVPGRSYLTDVPGYIALMGLSGYILMGGGGY